MIIDGFTFYNEFDLLECRLEYLYDHVDKFVLCESNLTHAGNPKPLYFLENINRYKKYIDKIHYSPLFVHANEYNFTQTITECDYASDYFTMDRRQRNHISLALRNYPDDTTVLISDLDEIPNIDVFPLIQEKLKTHLAIALIQQSLYYNLKNRHPNFIWRYASAAKKQDVMFWTPSYIREIAVELGLIEPAGWHLSYFMDAAGVSNKLKNFAHQEFNREEWTNEQRIIECMNNRTDPLGRFQLEQPNRNEFPEHFMRVFGKYYT